MREGVFLGRGERPSNSHRILDVKKTGGVLNLLNSILNLGQYLVLINARLIERHQLEIEGRRVRLARVIGDLVPHVPKKLAATSGDVYGNKTRVLEAKI